MKFIELSNNIDGETIIINTNHIVSIAPKNKEVVIKNTEKANGWATEQINLTEIILSTNEILIVTDDIKYVRKLVMNTKS